MMTKLTCDHSVMVSSDPDGCGSEPCIGPQSPFSGGESIRIIEGPGRKNALPDGEGARLRGRAQPTVTFSSGLVPPPVLRADWAA